MIKLSRLMAVLFVFALATSAWAETQLTSNRHVFVKVANPPAKFPQVDAVLYGGGDTSLYDAYYIIADGGGLNQLHITTDWTNVYGQVTALSTGSTSPSGTFYIPTTGGRGYNDTVILMVAIKGTVPSNLTINVKSSGYSWSTPGSTPGTYADNVINQTFTASDFSTYGYGPHYYKPGPGTLGTWSLPIYYNQSDFSTDEHFLFIDLKVGNLVGSYTYNGAAKVDFAFTNLTVPASFNAYSWCYSSNQGEGINWTQLTSGTGSSGYSINTQ